MNLNVILYSTEINGSIENQVHSSLTLFDNTGSLERFHSVPFLTFMLRMKKLNPECEFIWNLIQISLHSIENRKTWLKISSIKLCLILDTSENDFWKIK